MGAAGGTENIMNLAVVPEADFVIFNPKDKDSLAGFGLNYSSDHLWDRQDDIKFNGSSENLQTETIENDLSIGTEFYLASKASREKHMGFMLGYTFSYDPAVFQWVTDSTVSPASSYTVAMSDPDYSNDYTHGVNAAAGFNFFGEDSVFSLSIDYAGAFTDSSDEYVEVDTDGDGFNDTVYALYDYLSLPAAQGGPSEAVTGKDFVNYTFSNNVDLNLGLNRPLGDGNSMILSGTWNALGLAYSHYAKHILTESVTTDDSYLDKFYNSSLGSFSANVAFDFYDKTKKVLFRIGGGYSRYAETFSQTGDTAAGIMLFSDQNDGNYTEMNLGLDPANNVLSNAGIYPALQEIHTFLIDACWRWTPEKKVTLFLDLGASAYLDTKTYRAYNLDTKTIWEEKNTAAEADWMLSSAAGISFPVGEKITCMVDLNNIGFVGDFSFADETRMYDTEILRYSDNGDGYLLTENGADLDLSIRFSWSF